MNMPPPPPGGSYPQPPPGWQPSPVPPPGYYYAQQGRTSGLAVASMVLGIVWVYWIGSILAVIFGHIAISQTNRDPNLRGRGMAVAGLVLGYVGIALLVVTILAVASSSTT
jgi:hypothetical protein